MLDIDAIEAQADKGILETSPDTVLALCRELREARAEIDRYQGWTQWKDGIWSITHPPSGPSAEWLGEGLDEAIEAASAAGGEG